MTSSSPPSAAAAAVPVDRKDALLIIDIQNDFLPPNGALAVPSARDILPVVRALVTRPEGWDLVCASLDSHPAGHVSFASSHTGRKPFEAIPVPLGEDADDGQTTNQMLWPDHCVTGTPGWELESSLQALLAEQKCAGAKVEYVRKGTDKSIDAYSAFSDNQYSLFTPLPRLLFANGITHVTVVGLALDYCVRASVLDAVKFGLAVTVVRAGVRAVSPEEEERFFADFERKGVRVV